MKRGTRYSERSSAGSRNRGPRRAEECPYLANLGHGSLQCACATLGKKPAHHWKDLARRWEKGSGSNTQPCAVHSSSRRFHLLQQRRLKQDLSHFHTRTQILLFACYTQTRLHDCPYFKDEGMKDATWSTLPQSLICPQQHHWLVREFQPWDETCWSAQWCAAPGQSSNASASLSLYNEIKVFVLNRGTLSVQDMGIFVLEYLLSHCKCWFPAAAKQNHSNGLR